MKTPNRFSSLKLENGNTARNRIVVPAMASSTATPEGDVTDATVAHYSRLARAGTGILMVEYSFVLPSGRSEDNQLGVAHDEQIPGLARVASAIRESGAISLIQLTHSGGKTERALTGGVIEGPSDIVVPALDRVLEAPTPMTLAQIREWQDAFVAAAGRARAAGFDGIELHSAHGYGLNQWLSAYTNRRTDAYGGSTENRARILVEIIRRVRALYPELLISIRIPGQDLFEEGLTIHEMQEVALILQAEGVDILSVSSGLGGWRRPRDRRGEGYLVSEAREIQKVVALPVIGVGGIESGAYVDAALAARDFSLAAVGRFILKDPDAAAAELTASKAESETYCLSSVG